jgi:hypothetical protein
MFNKTKISDNLYGIVGWRQSNNPDYDILDSDNCASRSGYYINDNPFAKIEYLKDTQDYPDLTDDNFNENIANLQKSAITDICSRVFNEASYIDRNLLFINEHNKVNIETLISNGFVGYEIEIDSTKNIAIKITRLICDFANTGEFTLYLFSSAKKHAIYSQVITVVSDNHVETLNWVLDNTNNLYKGSYYIGYFTDEFSLQPYSRDYENSNVQSCFSFLEIEPFNVPNTIDDRLWDLTKMQGESNCFGLNFDITVYEDYTDLIIQNEHLFARAIYLNCVIMAINSYVSSITSNRNERFSKENLLRATVEIEGQTGENALRITGLRPQLNAELKTITQEIEKLKEGYFGKSIQIITLS